MGRFWNFNIGELALYDLPAVVDHVLRETGHTKVAFIGHSQGNATMFVSLARGMRPQLASKLSCFIALAPAVFAGPLTTGFPFTYIKQMKWKTWRKVFGVLGALAQSLSERMLTLGRLHPAHDNFVQLCTQSALCSLGLPDVLQAFRLVGSQVNACSHCRMY